MFEGNQNNLGMLSNKIETAIESNPKQAAKQLPQGSPIQQEAVQATQNGPQAEVNNKIVDDYVNLINENFGEDLKYIKPNYETLKNMPFGIDRQDELVDSYWWEEQMARNEMFDNPRTKNFIKLQPGFDYDYDAIKADYPEAYYKGESPEELKEKEHNIVLEDFTGSGDVNVITDYIADGGDWPLSLGDFGYMKSDPIQWGAFNAIQEAYPEYFRKYDTYTEAFDKLREDLVNKQPIEEVNPVTAKMNEGLSEDDPDYFGPDSRIQKPIAKTGRRINA